MIATTSPATTAPPPTLAPVPTSSVPIATASLGTVRGRTIAIDPGHNGANYADTAEISRPIFIGTQSRACDTTGTQTNDGYTESAYNFDVAVRLRDILQAAGAHVVMSRTSNDGWGPCIDERAAFANRAHADVAISIHADGGPASGRGFHVNMPALVPGYTDDIYARSHTLGVDIRDAFTATGMPTSTYFGSAGLVERSDLGGLNLSDVPKVLVETGNMRNATDAALLEDPGFRQRDAQALAAGLARTSRRGEHRRECAVPSVHECRRRAARRARDRASRTVPAGRQLSVVLARVTSCTSAGTGRPSAARRSSARSAPT